MSDTVIEINNLTKDYGKGRGVFDLNLQIKRGEVFGFVGTNGSGKTTTIRNLMGFIRPDGGTSSVLGLNSWTQSTEIMKNVSYVPGEIAFPSLATGTEFLKSQAEYLGLKDFSYMNRVISLLQLDPSANLKRMSKGMKQKTALVAALMGNKDILVLDEPSTGLDPLMRDAFLSLIREEKAKGRTIFMSSHIFEEIEDTCDRVAMIKDGKIVDTVDLWQLRHWKTKTFEVTFASQEEAAKFVSEWAQNTAQPGSAGLVKIEMPLEQINLFFQRLSGYSVKTLREQHYSLEQYFKTVYKEGALQNGTEL